ncbi:MAG: hypothetical protein KME07_08000 [Pegethrix bostrychoides GSE-TBD4-15B]|jgi:hypothetical protein|uniref:Uncharacterized protein n=1 Tax=Pegethrix bostrychoides GSE-TBD4-15B TaxID=2839662 RepID=A0A951P9G6_9CYAN|nr:hypothetical protein [Pegethrix bostrychoides GSE-TBD4-15B]
MDQLLDELRSRQLAEQVKSKARKPFDNAYRAALVTEGAAYVQGFVVYASKPYRLIEHAWLELEGAILDPNFPHLKKQAAELNYFAAQRLSVKQLKAAVEEAKEDYPDDDPLPIYGAMPYEYYGDVMLGGSDYMQAHHAAEAKCRELTRGIGERN